MVNTVNKLYARYGEILRYLIVGGLTTVINVALFYLLFQIHLSWFWANLAAWLASVMFAFVANKWLVFGQNDGGRGTLLREGVLFFGLRGASLLADTAILFVGINLLAAPVLGVKIVDQVVVIALNYVFSKLIFK
ncbi:GtrA family protein [Lacticaseibacillus sharpeae]|uniref:GtrA/DPMS transmembrane domain-containing protein n=1 Tax=Lacticaseibacillus sharpeae JCM 1186 = DSM 20505 TaxID=1291052 RepID=A0A0R1ZPK1_9LACO|nr:GtrA family protein [Lacticaseibacillus sharpeae]KRM55108.1 hypothetical protein FC18_GL001555 [Lacticaseibacillus sharpeae JCM 1186 = DSM 20505]